MGWLTCVAGLLQLWPGSWRGRPWETGVVVSVWERPPMAHNAHTDTDSTAGRPVEVPHKQTPETPSLASTPEPQKQCYHSPKVLFSFPWVWFCWLVQKLISELIKLHYTVNQNNDYLSIWLESKWQIVQTITCSDLNCVLWCSLVLWNMFHWYAYGKNNNSRNKDCNTDVFEDDKMLPLCWIIMFYEAAADIKEADTSSFIQS